ncbi:MAG TPA: glycosyltransferase family 39 protein [Methylomirabilota bacterium]|jgi:4-amino-4-deoxy-L-arabinose transferase-like glycosyltransferase
MWSALDRYEPRIAATVHAWRWWLVAGLLVVYLGVTGAFAHYRPLWNDELFTVYIARLPTASDVWRFLASGVEQIPPTFHLLTRLAMRLFGEHPVTVRLPSILAMGAMATCLYVIVSRRASAAYGLIALLLPLLTEAHSYAYEARPYALLVAFSAASLLCWQSAAAGVRRPLALVGLALTLAAALCSHYYAALSFLPLAAGELSRSRQRRRIDLPIWIALAVGTSPLVVFVPLVEAGRRLAATFWARPRWHQMAAFYQHVLAPAAVPLLLVILAVGLYALARSSVRTLRPAPPAPPPPRHELIAAVGYLALPVVAVALGKLATGAFTDRYALPAVIGVALLVPWGAYHLLDRRATIGLLLAALLGGWFALMVGALPVLELRRAWAERDAPYRFLATGAPGDLPVVVQSPHTFFQMTYYAPPALAARLLYLADPAAARRYIDTDTVDLGLLEFRRWIPIHVEPYRPYLAAHHRFLLYDDRGAYGWLSKALVADGARFDVAALDGGRTLFLVDVGPATGPGGGASRPRRQTP